MPKQLKKTSRPFVKRMATTRVHAGVSVRAMSKPVIVKTSATTRPVASPIAARTGSLVKTAKRAGLSSLARPDRKNVFLLLVPFAVFLILSLLLIGLRVSVGHVAGDISDLEAHGMQLRDENNRYLARAEQLASYSRISRLAHERLGLVGLAPKLIVVSSE